MTAEEAIKELRDASDDEVRYGDTEHHYNEVMKRIEAFDMAIKALEQQQKTGKWIVYDVIKFGDFVGTEKYECSECHVRVGVFISKFCSNCGARMDIERR